MLAICILFPHIPGNKSKNSTAIKTTRKVIATIGETTYCHTHITTTTIVVVTKGE